MTSKTLGDYTLVKDLEMGTLGSSHVAEHRFLKRPFGLRILPEAIVNDPDF
jgi:hypothetical protein